MTAAVIVTMQNKQVDKVVVDKDYFVLGRSRRCDVILDDKNVSREHAVIVRKHNAYELQDRGSRNGTVLNGSPVSGSMPLADGDRISIPPYEIQFLESGGSATRGDNEEKTAFMDAGKEKRSKRGGRNKRPRPGHLRYSLVAVEGPLKGTSYANWEGDLTLGRGDANKVIMPDDAVSQSHARMWEDDGLFFIEDLGSSNGTFVEGVRIHSSRLKKTQKIRIGSSTFLFTLEDPEKKKFMVALTALSTVFVIALALVVLMMMPEDRFEPIIEKGLQELKRGKYAAAKEQFQKVLKERPDDENAVRYLKIAEAAIDEATQIAAAKTAAESEQYDEALDICYKLLRKYPKSNKAKELEAIIKTVQEARIAFDANNWPDAVRYLKKARTGYPNSDLLERMLNKAQSELTAQHNLAAAREFVTRKQPDSAREILIGIPADSVYYAEAQEILHDIRSEDALSGAIAEARETYRNGHIDDALSLINKGLEEAPANSRLLSLKEHIAEVSPLVDQIRASRDLLESDDVDAVRAGLQACRNLLKVEPDAENRLRAEADEASRNLQLRLGEMERDAMVEARALHAQGKAREAYKYYLVVLKASPGNEEAAGRVQQIKEESADNCRKHYQRGLVHAELGQNDLAIEAFQQALDNALEGDNYYDRAKAKLDQLRR